MTRQTDEPFAAEGPDRDRRSRDDAGPSMEMSGVWVPPKGVPGVEGVVPGALRRGPP